MKSYRQISNTIAYFLLTLFVASCNSNTYKKNLTRVTSSPHQEIEPQWSPEGDKLSYGSGFEGDQNVAVYDLNLQKESMITQGLGFVHATSWSPDGKDIAYVTTEQTPNGINSHVFIVNLGNLEVTQLTDVPSIDGSPSWSPDGHQMAFPSRRSGGVFNLWLQPLSGEEATMVTDHPEIDHGPEWSPDGSKIAFHSERGNTSSIWILNLIDNTVSQLTDDEGNDYYPDWSPDGQAITFSSDRSGNHDIWIQALKNQEPIQVTTDSSADSRSSWSPKGDRIAFASNRQGSFDIWLIDVPPIK